MSSRKFNIPRGSNQAELVESSIPFFPDLKVPAPCLAQGHCQDPCVPVRRVSRKNILALCGYGNLWSPAHPGHGRGRTAGLTELTPPFTCLVAPLSQGHFFLLSISVSALPKHKATCLKKKQEEEGGRKGMEG